VTSQDNRERFKLALCEFLGERAQGPDVLEGLRISDTWHLEEILSSILIDDQVPLTREKFNQLMLHCGRLLASRFFFEYFFSKVRSISDFEAAVLRFRIKAMWLFGNFRTAFRILSRLRDDQFQSCMNSTEPFAESDFLLRSGPDKHDHENEDSGDPMKEFEPIPNEDLYLLGFISGKLLADLKFCYGTIRELLLDPQQVGSVLAKLGAERQAKVAETLRRQGLAFPSEGTSGLDHGSLASLSSALSKQVAELEARTKTAEEKAVRNTKRYLTLSRIDVYVATSMRCEEDYRRHREFVDSVFQHPKVRPLRLRYFDPTLSHDPNRITKGLVESLMLRRASVTIYSAGEKESLGKDSELASTLAQGKPVIVYVPAGPKMDERAQMFSVTHPLGLQIDSRTGVAHGILVVRSEDQCALTLRKLLLRELTFGIVNDGQNVLLVEEDTKCVVRVVSQNELLTHAFWTFFHAGNTGSAWRRGSIGPAEQDG